MNTTSTKTGLAPAKSNNKPLSQLTTNNTMKHKFTGREIGHAWWHETHDTYGDAGNMSFADGLMLSYSTGIARKCKTEDGRVYAIINSRRFSNTTCSHMKAARAAIPGDVQVFYVDAPRGAMLNHSPALLASAKEADFREAIGEAAEINGNARLKIRRSKFLAAAQVARREATDICNFFSLPMPDWVNETDEEAEAFLVAEQAKNQKRDEEIRQQREVEAAEDLEAWLLGGPFNSLFYILAPRLRVNPRNQLSIETSLGAEIPYDEGRRAFLFCRKMREKGWRVNGKTFPIGSYQLSSVNEYGIVAGCHRITWEEIERFATQQGWMAAQSTENP